MCGAIDPLFTARQRAKYFGERHRAWLNDDGPPLNPLDMNQWEFAWLDIRRLRWERRREGRHYSARWQAQRRQEA